MTIRIEREMNHTPHEKQQKPGRQLMKHHPVQDKNHNLAYTNRTTKCKMKVKTQKNKIIEYEKNKVSSFAILI